ncbi:MAG: malto-oligosyltrehalose synthase [bacterium]
MRLPSATYRVQLNKDFPFDSVGRILDYLDRLGVSDIYASPITRARAGSSHGYDVVDPNRINPELGGSDGFSRLIDELHTNGMGWLQDFVPNHMAVSSENTMLMDMLEKGERSRFYSFFDIDPDHHLDYMRGRLLLPVLGDFYAECLVRGEIKLVLDRHGLGIRYHDLRLPIKMESYAPILERRLDDIEERLGANEPNFLKYLGNLHYIRTLNDPDVENLAGQIRHARTVLWGLYESDERIRQCIDDTLADFNGSPGDPASLGMLDQLISEQRYRLSFWKVATEEINYRRFFTVNDLISVRVEDDNVFGEVHTLIARLIGEGMIDGLRIDHVDGLRDPRAYLKKLRKLVGDGYLIVEKILEAGERLPGAWPVQGTTGYEGLNLVTGVLCKKDNRDRFTRLYFKFTRLQESYEKLLHEKKRLIIDKHMAGNIDTLAEMLKRLSGQDLYGRDITLNGLRRALVEVMSQFPVYRTYIDHGGSSEIDRRYITTALDRAMGERPDLQYELNFLRKFLLPEGDADAETGEHDRVEFIMTFQQFTGPLMAKGLEDTMMYVYNKLLSCNEVGGDPNMFGVSLSDFHDAQRERLSAHPHTLVATATHDTKRGEDVRARINVLSEIPRDWESHLKSWARMNRPRRKRIGRLAVPDHNDEYFLYQTLLGTYPFDGHDDAYIRRIREYIIKAVREAKVHTAWIKPDTAYEEAFLVFVDKLLRLSNKNRFLDAFVPFCRRVAEYGIFNSLSQTVLKCSCPGVPDFYQGTELWDFSLVDPDNRRPVDFERRKVMLTEILKRIPAERPELIRELLDNRTDGRVKMFVIHELLLFRRDNRDLMDGGEYVPLEAAGIHSDNVIAFARRLDRHWSLTVAPRFVTNLIDAGGLPVGKPVWGDTAIAMPREAPRVWRDVLTEDRVQSEDGSLAIGDVLRTMPVSVLVGEARGENVPG